MKDHQSNPSISIFFYISLRRWRGRERRHICRFTYELLVSRYRNTRTQTILVDFRRENPLKVVYHVIIIKIRNKPNSLKIYINRINERLNKGNWMKSKE